MADTEPSFTPIILCFPVPKHPHLKCHAHLTFLKNCTVVHLTTSDLDIPSTTVPMGSFVYAMPDRLDPKSAISTPLVSSGSSEEYATRLAKILARKLNQPTYVGTSMNLSGVTMEEEMEGLREIVTRIADAHQKAL